jgi:hypothetical protein
VIPLECVQGETEWLSAKLGVPSSSHFDEIVTTKGDPSKSSQGYMRRLAYERITGQPHSTFVSYDMKRGIENEPIARALYELVKGVEVKQVGLGYFDERKLWLSSPDGLIDPDGGLEIKDAKPSVQMDRLLDGWPMSFHFQQIQGNMFVWGRSWWDRMSHCLLLPPLIHRYYRDDTFCAKLKVALEGFCFELDAVEKRLRELA